MKKIRPLAIHLPQFHAIPENDQWWGKGFTEWTNVKKAKPLFLGHHQPHIPQNNNYYDLSQLQHLNWQKQLAKEHGIYGFCFYHYWFNGKVLLDKPVDLVLKDDTWDFPFCLCWANENWTRTWDGKEKDILMQQEYSTEDDCAHFEYLEKFFHNKNYIRVDNKPVLLVYRSEMFPDSNKTTDLWRQKAISAGFDGLYLIRVEGFLKNIDPQSHGFDASMDFQPDWSQLPKECKEPIFDIILRKIKNQKESQYSKNKVFSYKQYVEGQIKNEAAFNEYKRYSCVMPSWDNSARRQEDAVIFKDSNPDTYRTWLDTELSRFTPFSQEENFVFINAWNEWAEGNHLEPCQRWGDKYLKATREAISAAATSDD